MSLRNVLRVASGTLLALLALGPLTASAQIPQKDQTALSFAVGPAIPFNGDYKTGFLVEASLDYYLRQSYGVRGTAGYTRNSTSLPGDPSGDKGYFLVSGFYTWNLGELRPFASLGVGLFAVNPAEGSTTARVGLVGGGGVEYFVKRRWAITGEARVDLMNSVATQTQSFLGVTAGVRYFF